MDKTLFQYCQKIVLFRNGNTEVLLARRRGEADYDQVYSLVGGKLETTDSDLLAGLKREKNEEIGESVQVSICPTFSYNVHFIKADGQSMILPHYYAEYVSGEVKLSSEYSDYQWVSIKELATFKPKIENIPQVVSEVLKLRSVIDEGQLVVI